MSLGQGYVRVVFHRSCNAAERKVMNAIRRCVMPDSATFIAGLNPFHKLHETSQHGLIHPAHLTPEDRKERAKRQRQTRAECDWARQLASKTPA